MVALLKSKKICQPIIRSLDGSDKQLDQFLCIKLIGRKYSTKIAW